VRTGLWRLDSASLTVSGLPTACLQAPETWIEQNNCLRIAALCAAAAAVCKCVQPNASTAPGAAGTAPCSCSPVTAHAPGCTMKLLVTCLAKPGRGGAAAPPLAPASPRAPRRRSVVGRAGPAPAPAARTAGAPPRRTPSADAEAALVADVAGGNEAPGAAAPGFSNNVVAVDAALLPSAAHALPVRLPPAHETLPVLSWQRRARRSSFCELQLPGPCAAIPYAWRQCEACAQVAPARPPAAPLTTAMACELANAHAPYMQVRPRHGCAHREPSGARVLPAVS
jgi:hypothetical protein